MKLQLANNRAAGRNLYSPDFIKNAPANLSRVQVLTDADRQEVLEFLKLRPVHTVVMTSFINDNGLENPDNRGIFFGYRSLTGELEGVALIGHTTLVEARSAARL